MPRPAITPEQRLETRERIRAAAATLVRRGNPESITIRAVAKQAGVSVGTIYKYFADISDLGRSLWQEPVEALRGQMLDIVRKTDDPVARIRALLQEYADFARDKERVFRGAFLYVRPETRPKPDAIALEEEPFFQHLQAAILEGQKSGVIIDGNAKTLAQLLWAALHGALALPNNIETIAFDPPKKMADEMIDSIMVMIDKR
ncbi:MAG: TetR/AcrR family transcriptional regulator [Parasphingorhabdus sp.]|uniref:TetR/AcrR family transcriptional regulator n=1 Tax=Parasphingorhabdus sp. TaxID=2709688 RepID=UPI0032999434